MDLSKSYEFFQPSKRDEVIHIIGCGSVGSTVAESLARCGVKKIELWDFDTVEPHNIANQMFVNSDIGKSKTEAVKNMILAINPEAEEYITTHDEGWNDEVLSGFVFLCVDSMKIRREIVERNRYNRYIKAMFDFRTRLTDAQHYAADWSSFKMKEDFYNTMQFSDDEAKEQTAVSACNVELSVCPTIRAICAAGVANFMNFWSESKIKKMILIDAFAFSIVSF